MVGMKRVLVALYAVVMAVVCFLWWFRVPPDEPRKPDETVAAAASPSSADLPADYIFDRSVSTTNEAAKLELLRGNERLSADDPVGAERHYRKAVALDPRSSGLFSSVGVSLHLQWRFTEAQENYHKALELDARNDSAHVGLAGISYHEGNHAAAITRLESVLARDPSNMSAQWGLAISYKAARNVPAAREAFMKFLDMDADPERAGTAKRYLSQTEGDLGARDGSSARATLSADPPTSGAVHAKR